MVNKNWNSFKENNLNKFLKELKIEWNKQDIKFPEQQHSLSEWFVIIMEEIGEFATEILNLERNHYNFDLLYKEIIQSITLLIRLRYSVYSINYNHLKDKVII